MTAHPEYQQFLADLPGWVGPVVLFAILFIGMVVVPMALARGGRR